MGCTKCEYYKKMKYSDGDEVQVVNSVCVSCKVLFPWLTDSQFKEKENKCTKCDNGSEFKAKEEE